MEMFKRVLCKDEEEWLKKRKLGIGGSSCSSIIGRNPYMSNTEYWEIKMGLKEPKDISNNHNVVYGKNAEELVREFFKMDYAGLLNVEHRDYELLIRVDKPYIRSSLDGEIEVLKDCIICGKELKAGMKGILEIKTTEPMRSASLECWKEDNVPDNYHCQRLHYLLTTNYDFHILRCDFRAYFNESQYWKHWTKDYCVLREEMKPQLEYLEEEETKFWNINILKKVRPGLLI